MFLGAVTALDGFGSPTPISMAADTFIPSSRLRASFKKQ
jgi:hypothetical protein